jgi:hypothetical protein
VFDGIQNLIIIIIIIIIHLGYTMFTNSV